MNHSTENTQPARGIFPLALERLLRARVRRSGYTRKRNSPARSSKACSRAARRARGRRSSAHAGAHAKVSTWAAARALRFSEGETSQHRTRNSSARVCETPLGTHGTATSPTSPASSASPARPGCLGALARTWCRRRFQESNAAPHPAGARAARHRSRPRAHAGRSERCRRCIPGAGPGQA